MANEFIARKGLISLDDSTISGSLTINTSGSTVFDIQGSQGQLFSVTDSLTGVLMSVNDISGLPILEVSSDDKVIMGTFGAEGLIVTGSNVNIGKIASNIHTVTGSLNVSGALNVNGSTSLGALSVTDFTASGNVKLGDAVSDTHTLTGSLNVSGSINFYPGTGAGTALSMNNNNIANVNHITIGDPGPGEGIEWLGGNGWKIYESPNDLTTNSAGNLQIVSSSTRVLTVGTDRIVNIPNGELNITSSAAGPTVLLYDSTAGNDPFIRFVPATTTNAFAVGIDDSDSDKFKISYGSNAVHGTNDRLTIDTSGNVGIGTTTPTQKLEVNGNISARSSDFVQIEVDQTDSGKIVMGVTSTTSEGFLNVIPSGSLSPNLKFLINTTEAARINSSGNVGIGVSNPSHKLDVSGSLRFNGIEGTTAIRIDGGGSTDTSIFRIDANNNGDSNLSDFGFTLKYMGSRSGNDNSLSVFSDNQTAGSQIEALTILQDGKIGLNKSTPSARLDVNGDAIVTGSLTVTGTIIAQEFKAELVSSSIIYESGSTKFGDSIDDVHQRTGSLLISGSVDVSGVITNSTGTVRIESVSGQEVEIASTRDVRILIDSNNDDNTNRFEIQSNTNTSNDNNIVFVVEQDGHTGIGTNTPLYPLHVSQSESTTGVGAGILIEQAGTGDAVVQFLLPGVQRWVAGIDNSDSDKFKIASSIDLGSNDRLTIDTSGNVGLNTNAPSSILHIKNTTNPTLIYLQGRNTAGDDIGIRFTHTDGGSSAGYIGTKVSTGGGSGDLIFSTVNESSGEKMRISASGNVGIGISTPSYKLDIDDNATTGAGLRVTGGGTGADFVTFVRDVGGTGTISFNAENSRPQMKFVGANTFAIGESGSSFVIADDTTVSAGGTNGTQRLVINSSGNVGIGTTSPSIKLEVSGSIGAPNFTSGFTGGSWRLDYSPSSSSLEVDNLIVRGQMRVYELLINQIRATNGTLFVSSVGKVETVTGGPTTFFLSFDTGSGGTLGHGFVAGDIIRAQRVNPANPSSFVYRCDLTVTGVSANGKFVTASLTGSTAPSGGMEFVRLGNTASLSNRQGTVYLTADDTNAPFIDVIDGVASHADWNTASGSNRLKTRMGRLNGITGTSFGNLTGYGFYASGSAYLEGGINATTGNIGGFAITKDAITGSGFYISGGAASNGFFISSSGFNIKGNGNITASAGRIGQWNITDESLYQAFSGNLLILGNPDNVPGGWTSTWRGIQVGQNASNRIWLAADEAGTNYEFTVYSGANYIVRLGNVANQIAGWNIDTDAIYTGTKDTSGYSTTGITLGSGGSIHSPNFYIDTSGNAFFKGTLSAPQGNIGGFAITADALTGSGFYISGGAASNGFFISSSKFNVKGNGDVTGSNVLFTGGKIGGFTITNDVLSGTGFLLSGSATGNGFFISSSGFNVKASGNITASAGLVGGWSLSSTELSSGNVSLLATSVSGGLYVTSGSERILTVGNFVDVPITTTPGLFATASLNRSTTNGTVSIASSSNSLTISRLTSTTPSQYVVTTVTQSLGNISAGRVIALRYDYADLTTYTASAANVVWNNTQPSASDNFTLPNGSSTTLTPITSSRVSSGEIAGGKGIVYFEVSSSYFYTLVGGGTEVGTPRVERGILIVKNSSDVIIGTHSLNIPSGEGIIAVTPITQSNFDYTGTNSTIKFEAEYLWNGESTTQDFYITSSLGIKNLRSTLYIPAEFSASISSSGGTVLLNTYKHTDDQPYSRTYADDIPVPTALTNVKLIFTVKQLGSGSAYTNLPSYNISNILVSADVPKVNITRNQAIFYNSPLQYMEWTTSSFTIKGDIEATDLTVRGTTNLLGPVNIEGDISAHPDIQGANSTNNSAGTVIQNLTFDAFGHTTNVTTTNLDTRYQPVGSYVTLGTDQTITGLKTISGSNINGASNPDEIFPALNIRGGNNTQDTVVGIVTTGIYAKAGNATADGTDATTVAIYGAEGTTGGGTPASAKTYAGYFSGNILTTKTGSFAHVLPLSDNTGTVGTSALTWANGQFTNFTVDSALTAGTITTTGNAKLGDTTADIHTVTGSLRISGSLQLAGGFTANVATQTYNFNNGDLTAVNQVYINDPGEGIVFGGNTSGDVTIRVEDDSLDNRFRIIGQTNTRGEILDTIYITGSNVGVGITTPTKTFTVQINDSDTTVATGRNLGGGAAGAGIKLENISTTTNSYVNLDFRANTADGRIGFVNKGTNSGEFHFITDNGGTPTSHVVIQDDGDVGIGTTSPTAKLQVVGQISGSSVRAAYSSSVGNPGMTVQLGYLDANSLSRIMTFENGILVNDEPL